MIEYSDGSRSIDLPYTADRAAMITRIKEDLDLKGYPHRLPDTLEEIWGNVYLSGYDHPLPIALKYIWGSVVMRGYSHPLPPNLKEIGSCLQLAGYNHPLPESLSKLMGGIELGDYDQPLPTKPIKVWGRVDLNGYTHPLPPWMLSAGKSRGGTWFVAVRHINEWFIIAVWGSFTVDQALDKWKHNPECLALVNNLAEQIEQSPLK